MKKAAYLSIACDTDPDINPPYRDARNEQNPEDIWQGIARGISALRQRLEETSSFRKHGSLPITWLLRCDRQIYELYGDSTFCFRRFEDIWKTELNNGNEIGWHPHLCRWSDESCQWLPYLGKDDDLQVLADCLNSFRKCIDIRAVRTGWDYHSNRLLEFFDRERLLVDASAIPGSVQSVGWAHDWTGTPRTPYLPSKSDYRNRAKSSEDSLSIVEMPVLVRELALPHHLIRHCVRSVRAYRNANFDLPNWESARWQGLTITMKPGTFSAGVQQTLGSSLEKGSVFLTSYFHTDELLSSQLLDRFIQNLENLNSLSDSNGYTLTPTTLSAAVSIARNQGLAC
jgi:hypothetical protein